MQDTCVISRSQHEGIYDKGLAQNEELLNQSLVDDEDAMDLERLNQDEGVQQSLASDREKVLNREQAESVDLSNVPASPVRDEWPKDSLLSPSHFTIDKQDCLACNAKLGWAMPMNRIPKVQYLYCSPELYDPSNPEVHPGSPCFQKAILQCWACTRYFVKDKGNYVFRPGNCAYSHPTQIFSFMCTSCYKDQLANEPGLEETKKQMAEYRRHRKECEEKEKDILSLADSSNSATLYSYQSSQLHPGSCQPIKKRKRFVVPTGGGDGGEHEA